jgi:hypothetical protein
MKSILIKLSLLGVILFSFSLQAFTPPLPNVTTIKITDLQFTDQYGTHDYYAAKVYASCEYDLLNPGYPGSTPNILVSLPRDEEWFPTTFQAQYTSSTGPLTTAGLYVKETSTSNWQYLGSLNCNSMYVTRYVVDNYLYVMEFSKNAFVIPEEPIE